MVCYFGFYRGFSNDRGESESEHRNQFNIGKIKDIQFSYFFLHEISINKEVILVTVMRLRIKEISEG